jgi:GlcNAc-PI de-N-acetylase
MVRRDVVAAGFRSSRGRPRALSRVALLLVSLIAGSLAVISTSGASTAGCSRRVLNIVAHHDDDILFLNPDVRSDINKGYCVRTLFITGSDAALGLPYLRSRERGIQAAYAQMAGQANSWTLISPNTPGFGGELVEMAGNPRVELMYMHLPDGQGSGAGYPLYNNVSLEKLFGNRISAMSSVVNPAVTYTREGLIAAIASVMNTYQPHAIRTQARSLPIGLDHSDHLAVPKFVELARARFSSPHAIYFYTDYPIWFQPSNLTASDATAKETAFFTYAPYDSLVCQNRPQCDTAGYGAWFSRRFIEGSMFSGASRPSQRLTT